VSATASTGPTTSEHRPRHVLNRLFWILVALPFAWFPALYAFVLRARLALGRWPSPYQPDPKDLGFGAHHAAIALLLSASMLAGAPVLLALFIRGHAQLSVRRWLVGLGLYALGFALILGMAWLDPGHFIEWYFD
jgi:hypothetical protein